VQVTAVGKAEADVLAEVLARKGFRTLVAPGPNDKLFRVLVGPAKDINDVAKLKGDLEAATGLKNTFVRKY
jgi:cell division septation protein DedD